VRADQGIEGEQSESGIAVSGFDDLWESDSSACVLLYLGSNRSKENNLIFVSNET